MFKKIKRVAGVAEDLVGTAKRLKDPSALREIGSDIDLKELMLSAIKGTGILNEEEEVGVIGLARFAWSLRNPAGLTMDVAASITEELLSQVSGSGGNSTAEILYIDDAEGLTISLVELDGDSKETSNPLSDTAYEVIDGSGEFRVEGRSAQYVESGSIVCIPAGTLYQDVGEKLVMLVHSRPVDN